MENTKEFKNSKKIKYVPNITSKNKINLLTEDIGIQIYVEPKF